ncbi:MAG: hypothetical protein ACM362_10510 [Candidatus Methylomirabilota bacterium]
MLGKQSLRRISVVFGVALVALLCASPTSAQTNNPYPSQVVAPNYHGADPSLGGYVLPFARPADDQVLAITLPFQFTFYGVPYNGAYVSTNGYINFLAPSSFYTNSCPIQRDSLSAAIYPFWDDLYLDSASSVRTRLLGEAPSRQFVIEWYNVRFWDDASSRLSFEIVLSENGGITFQYLNLAASNLRVRGSSATIGVESQTGEFSSQFSCNTASLGPGNFAIRFGQSTQVVAVDIKPGDCPNPFNVGSKGVLPVAILGTANFDVTTIDPTQVTLAGVSPLRWGYEDVSAPASQCSASGPDGHMDMTLKFDSEEIAKALGAVNDGQELALSLTGSLRTGTLQTATQQNGTPIAGEDMVIIKKGK